MLFTRTTQEFGTVKRDQKKREMGHEYDLAIHPSSEPPSSSDASRNVCEWDMKRGLVFLAINSLKRSGQWEQVPVPKELREEGDGYAFNAFSKIRRNEWLSMCEELQRVGRIERYSMMQRIMVAYEGDHHTCISETQLFWGDSCTETFWFMGEETNRDFAFVYERIDHDLDNRDWEYYHHWLRIPTRLDLRQRSAGIFLWLSGSGRMLHTIKMMNKVLAVIVDRFPTLFRIIDFDGGRDQQFETCNQFYSGKWWRYHYGKTILWKGHDSLNKESKYFQVGCGSRFNITDALTLKK